MDDRILAYLLGQLDAESVRTFEADLTTNPDLFQRTAQIRRTLAPLDDLDSPEPPPGLAARTLAFIAAQTEQPLPPAPPRRLLRRDAPDRPSGRWIEWVLAASIALVVGGLCLAWLGRAWNRSEVLACQQNLASLWQALARYGQNHQGALPSVTDAPGALAMAGSYVSLLHQAGVAPESLQVGCPGRGDRKVAPRYNLPELEQLYQMEPERFRRVMRDQAGDYAYTLGYRQDGQLRGPRLDSGDDTPLLADGPSVNGPGNSSNHGNRGQNVLFVGGNVRWLPTAALGPQEDDIYRNRQLRVRAGLDPTDCVLGAGDATTGP